MGYLIVWAMFSVATLFLGQLPPWYEAVRITIGIIATLELVKESRK
jgi:hypothetical protein